jgi:hypothetical protein
MKKEHLGSKFEDFLKKEGILESCRATAIKFKIARELERGMHRQRIGEAKLAKRLEPTRGKRF